MKNWIPKQPYQSLPKLPPRIEFETKTVLKNCIKARATLAELKQATKLIPNQAILINVLPLLEARASSEIENIVTTTDKLFKYLRDEEHADPATKEALRYSRALFEGYKELDQYPLSTRTAEKVCSQIKGVEMRVRNNQEVALGNEVKGEIIYTPPVGEHLLRDLLSNWEKFIHLDIEIDPLIRMAIGHYQFEAIHPFLDGNGRTGRIINSLYLIEQNLLTLPILYLSRYIIKHKSEYYRLLLEVTKNNAWEDWIVYILKGVEETASWTSAKISAINDISKHTAEYVRQKLPKIYSHELINLIFELPYCRISNVTTANIAKRQTASEYLKQLVAINVLIESESKKEKLFIHPKLMKLISGEENEFDLYE